VNPALSGVFDAMAIVRFFTGGEGKFAN